jgi:hypothetical protein
VDVVVTDDGLPAEEQALLVEQGVEVLLAEEIA